MKQQKYLRFWMGLIASTGPSACNLDDSDVVTTGVSLTGAPGASSRGFVVVSADAAYESYNVSLVSLTGEVQSESIISSGSASAGLSAPLTDVIMPSSAVPGPELVVINRSPAAFITWVDLETAVVRAQLNVGTGFEANPYDYVPLTTNKAYVTRHAPNFASGREDFDSGNDLLVIDPSVPAITGRVDLMPVLDGEAAGFFPRAGRALVAGGQLRLLALGFDENYLELVDSRIVSIDPETDEITQVLVLEGLQNCQNLALSPDGKELAVACSGPFGADPRDGFPNAGIVRLAIGAELSEIRRYGTGELGGSPINSLAYASANSLAFTTYGRFNADFSAMEAPDSARRLDLALGELDGAPLRQSNLEPFTLGDIRCAPGVSVCLLADAETDGGVLHRFDVDASGALVDGTLIELERGIGLPPRYIESY
jgi:hypothetical protein